MEGGAAGTDSELELAPMVNDTSGSTGGEELKLVFEKDSEGKIYSKVVPGLKYGKVE